MRKRYVKVVSLVSGLAASIVTGYSAKSSESMVITAAPATAEAETFASVESGDSAVEQKRMVLWDKSEYAEDYSIMMKAKADGFTSRNHVDVDYVIIPAADMKQKSMAAIEAGSAPDLIVGNDTLVGRFVSTQQIAGCSDIFGAVDFTENSKILGMLNGKPYLMLLASTASGMYLRMDQQEKTGMDIPTTWGELKKDAKLMNGPTNGFYGLGFAMGVPDGGGIEGFCRAIILDWGGIPVDGNGKVTVSSLETLETLKFITSLYGEGLAPPDVIADDDNWNNSTYLADTVGVITNSGSVVSGMREEKPELLANTQVVAYPAGPVGETFTLGGASALGMFGTGKNTDATRDSVKYYFEDLDNYNTMTEAMRATWQSVADGVDDTDSWKDPVNTRWPASSKNIYKACYPTPSDERATVSFTNQLYVKAIQEIVVNRADPQKVLDHLEAELSRVYNQ